MSRYLKYQILICSISYCLYFISNITVFSIIPILICLNKLKNVFHILIIFICIAAYFLIVDWYNSKDILLMSFSIILFSSNFNKYPLEVLKLNAYAILAMLLYLLFNEPKGGWDQVLNFSMRLSYDLPTGKYINPNPLGLVAAICSFSFIINKKYFFAAIPFIIMIFTQSRAAVLLFGLAILIYNRVSLKYIISLIMGVLALYYIFYDTPLMNRFLTEGDSGRGEFLDFYTNILKHSYLTGYSSRALDNIYFESGRTIDNMYYSLALRYGIIMGSGILFIFIVLFFINKIDETYRVRIAIFLAMLAYGFFEKGFLFFYMMWIPFSVCFNNLKKANI